MEKWKKRSVELLTSIAFGKGEGGASVVPYYPQKNAVCASEEKYFDRSSPEAHGVSSKRIYNLLCALEAEPRSNVHSLIILKDGEVISECSRCGYDVNGWHLSHSMSKTVTGMAIGMLVSDGVLDINMRLVDLFPDYQYKDKRFPEITLHHLLSMTAGVSFSEAGSVTEEKWCESFFASSLKFAPGSKFSYNSMNSYILAKIVTKVSGESLSAFLDRRLFSPLGITNYLWEKGPEGIEKGGWGLYLSAESWAKIGQMMLSGGVFSCKRILSEEWVLRSTATYASAPKADGDFNYGYQVWVGRRSDEVLFNGMLGQNVWICPKNKIVAVVFSGNNELFGDSPALRLIRYYLGGEMGDALHKRDMKILREREAHFFESRRTVRPLAKGRGLLVNLGLKARMPFDERITGLLGSFAFAENGEGLLPLFVRAMQNNLDSRIERVTLERYMDLLFMTVRESGVDYRIEVGLYGYEETVLDFRGEKYSLKALGAVQRDSEGKYELRIELVFPELPNTRVMTIKRISKDRVKLTLSEWPNNKIVDTLIERAIELNGTLGFVIGLLERRFGKGFMNKKLERTFCPELVGADTALFWYEGIIAELNLVASEETRAVRLLRAVVDRFFTESESEDERDGEEPRKRGSLIGELIRIYRSTGKEKSTVQEQSIDTVKLGRAIPIGPADKRESLPPNKDAGASESDEVSALSTEELLLGIEDAFRKSEEHGEKIASLGSE